MKNFSKKAFEVKKGFEVCTSELKTLLKISFFRVPWRKRQKVLHLTFQNPFTQETETSQYLKEKKSIEIASVTASESATA